MKGVHGPFRQHGVRMLSRRGFAQLGFTLVVSACQDRSQPVAASARVVVTVTPPNDVVPVLARLRDASPRLGFVHAQRRYHPELGYRFEMRRSDVHIVGITPPRPLPAEVPMGEDGPELDIQADEQVLDLGIFASSDDLTPEQLRSVVSALTSVIEEVDGAEVSVDYRTTG